MRVADVAIVGDLRRIVPALVESLRSEKAEKGDSFPSALSRALEKKEPPS